MHQVLSLFRKYTRGPCDLHRMHQIPLKTNERHRMPPRDIGGHLKGVMWLGTNIWMPLRSFESSEASCGVRSSGPEKVRKRVL